MAYPVHTVEMALGADPGDPYADVVFAVGDPLVYLRLAEASKAVPAADASGNGRVGTYNDAGSTMTFSQASGLAGDSADKSVKFAAASSATVTVADTTALRFGGVGSAFTIVAWFKRSVLGAGVTLRTHATPTNPAALIDVGVTATGITAMTGGFVGSISATTNDLNWHMVALTVTQGASTGTRKLYLDGALVASGTFVGVFTVELAGTTGIGPGGDIYVDEFCEYATELRADQIAAMYQANTVQTPLVWTDLSAYIRGGTITRGRQHETDTIQAGTCQLTLDNTDGRFDPLNAAGPYFGSLEPMRKVRVKFTQNAVTYTRYTGYVERWPTIWETPSESRLEITCVDGFEPLNLADVSGSTWPAETTGSRIGRALDAAYWSQTDRNLDTGQSAVIAATYATGSGQNALSHIQDVAASDLGYAFVSADGKATFHDRYHRSNNATSQATFGDGAGELPYEDLIPDKSKDLVANDVTVTASGGTPVAQRVTDSTSQIRYFPRSPGGPRTILVSTDAEALSMATELIRRYKTAATRIERMTLNPAAITGTDGDALWAQVLGREIGDQVTIVKRPSYGGTITQRVVLEQMQDTFDGLTWATSWQLSPAAQSVFWVLDDTSFSVLDSTTALAY